MQLLNPKFPNIYFKKDSKGRIKLYTKNLTPGIKFFDEQIEKEIEKEHKELVEYRNWDPKRSKLAAAILKEISQIGIKENNKILYLGASHGYTPSFLSDIIGNNGFIFALDFAPRVVRDLVFLCEKRKNITPILADANQPDTYKHRITKVDIVYMDVAQRNQAEIFLKNCDMFLKEDGFGLIAVKSRSIDITKKPKEIYSLVRKELEKKITVVDYRILDPYEADHAFFVCKKTQKNTN
ncbi:MAG: fibrillarin-like rRNA methylase [Candidatus Woesearchaeota archaeon]|nr:MAG: fibrillarin-like rRNA methylase [Candidatus Woesearchaeota archaeon]